MTYYFYSHKADRTKLSWHVPHGVLPAWQLKLLGEEKWGKLSTLPPLNHTQEAPWFWFPLLRRELPRQYRHPLYLGCSSQLTNKLAGWNLYCAPVTLPSVPEHMKDYLTEETQEALIEAQLAPSPRAHVTWAGSASQWFLSKHHHFDPSSTVLIINLKAMCLEGQLTMWSYL